MRLAAVTVEKRTFDAVFKLKLKDRQREEDEEAAGFDRSQSSTT